MAAASWAAPTPIVPPALDAQDSVAAGCGGFNDGAGMSFCATGSGGASGAIQFASSGAPYTYCIGNSPLPSNGFESVIYEQGASVSRFWYDTSYASNVSFSATPYSGGTNQGRSYGSGPTATTFYILASPRPCTPIWASDVAWQWANVPSSDQNNGLSPPVALSAAPGIRFVQSSNPSNVILKEFAWPGAPQTPAYPVLNNGAGLLPTFVAASGANNAYGGAMSPTMPLLTPQGVYDYSDGTLLGASSPSPPASTASNGLVLLGFQTAWWQTSGGETNDVQTLNITDAIQQLNTLAGAGWYEFMILGVSLGGDLGIKWLVQETPPTSGPFSRLAGAENTSTTAVNVPSSTWATQTETELSNVLGGSVAYQIVGVDPAQPQNVNGSVTTVGIDRTRAILRTSAGYLPYLVNLNPGGLTITGVGSTTVFPVPVSCG
jgi:hypothetical protein